MKLTIGKINSNKNNSFNGAEHFVIPKAAVAVSIGSAQNGNVAYSMKLCTQCIHNNASLIYVDGHDSSPMLNHKLYLESRRAGVSDYAYEVFSGVTSPELIDGVVFAKERAVLYCSFSEYSDQWQKSSPLDIFNSLHSLVFSFDKMKSVETKRNSNLVIVVAGAFAAMDEVKEKYPCNTDFVNRTLARLVSEAKNNNVTLFFFERTECRSLNEFISSDESIHFKMDLNSSRKIGTGLVYDFVNKTKTSITLPIEFN